jgi:adenylate cyclase
MANKQKPLSRKQKDAIVIIAIGSLGGLLYPILNKEYNELGPMLNGFFIGLISSGFIVLNEIIYNRAYVKQMKFRALVFSKTLIYSAFFTLVIVLEVSLERAIAAKQNLFEYLNSSTSEFIWNEDLHLIVLYMLAATTVIIFFYQMSRKMGQGVLWNFISGKYHKAREEERIFMFMDLNNSTELAEKLGDIEYNNLLNDFFFDITESILTNYGKIYRYVGDEIVVTWKLNKGLPQAHFIRTFFDSKRAIHLKREKYLKLYGLAPSFTAGFNYGKVIIGEIGEVKSQICFFGDVMYETTALEKNCKKYKIDNLVSETLFNLLDLPLIFSAKKEGEVEVPGFTSISAYSITEK